MGGSSSSPRKITLENPDENVIKITENVVERLQNVKEREPGKHSSPEKSKSSINYDVSRADGEIITSQQIRREVNNEIEKNNAYWQKRLKVLQEGYRQINTELEEEYNKAVKEVNETIGKHFVNSGFPDTCKESQSNIIQCYNLNRDQPLLCSKEVQKFNICVSDRMNLMLKAE